MGPMDVPSKPPPPGVKPDFAKDSPLHVPTIVISAVFLTLMYLFLGIRVYMRRMERWLSDDTMAVLTAICNTVFAGIVLSSVQSLGRHGWDIPRRVVSSAHSQKSMVAQHIFNASTLFLGKLCMLAMYYRIFGHIPKVRWQIIVTAILALPLFAAIIIRPVMSGPPIGKPWGVRGPWSKYIDIPGLMIGVDNIIVDACIAYIPIPIIYNLNLSASRKKGVLALFATGFIAVAADIVILYYRVMVFIQDDGLLYCYIAHNCSLVESTISVILSSLPSFAKFWRLHVEPSAVVQSLRSRFQQSDIFESPEMSDHTLPTFIQGAADKPRQRPRDPYSIGVTTRSEVSHIPGGDEDGRRDKWTKPGAFDAHAGVEVIVLAHEPAPQHPWANIERLDSLDLELPAETRRRNSR